MTSIDNKRTKYSLGRIEKPELFFGFVGAAGTNLSASITALSSELRQFGYEPIPIKVTDYFDSIEATLKLGVSLDRTSEFARITSFIKFGNELRRSFDSDEIIAAITVAAIHQRRADLKSKEGQEFSGKAFLLYQFKRKEEVNLLRSVYGRLFFQVSVYSHRAARVTALAKLFAKNSNQIARRKARANAEEIIQQDEDEVEEKHGQRVGKIFHDADLIVSNEVKSPNVEIQIRRFCRLLFSSNKISPNKHEYGMFLAKAAALRTLDLSRQVGAAIFTKNGEVVCLGSNEVPKAGGGTYWSDDEFDDREYLRGYDSNDQRKDELLTEVLQIAGVGRDRLAEFKETQIMDALEYGRIVHAEMSAISDAARNGRTLKDTVLYTTTFPCHMCAKHIVAVGVEKVVFLEPYPKSLAADLHSDSISIDGNDRGEYSKFPAVKFEHFFGITPRRYRELFERNSRKIDGKFAEYPKNRPTIFIDLKLPFYIAFEAGYAKAYQDLIKTT
jgi:deoxycytidylate deaminase